MVAVYLPGMNALWVFDPVKSDLAVWFLQARHGVMIRIPLLLAIVLILYCFYRAVNSAIARKRRMELEAIQPLPAKAIMEILGFLPVEEQMRLSEVSRIICELVDEQMPIVRIEFFFP
jgi:hypothetical protein